DADSLEAIRAALGEKDDNVRRAAVEALAALPGQNDPEPFIGVLRGQGYSSRVAAATALGKLDNARAIAALLEALGDVNTAYQAGQALRQAKGRKSVVAELIKGLAEGSKPEQRRQCAQILGELKDAAALDALLRAVGDRDATVRSQVATALGQLGD